MTEKAMQVLEFDKVKLQIQSYAACSLGKGLIEQLAPLDSADAATSELEAVDEALQVIYRYGSPPYGGITDVRPLLKKAAIGGVLGGSDLIAIADMIAGGRRVRQTAVGHAEQMEIPHLTAACEGMFDARQTEQEIRQRIADDGTIHDNASPTLRRLRSERRTWEARVRQVLEQMLRSHQKYLQDPVVTMRGNSLCLPVRIEYKNLVHGIVHDVSSSGATVFIEPQAAVEAGIRARELGLEEEREIERILQQVSGVVAEVADALVANADILGQIDAWFAKAVYAKARRCERPVIRTDGVWKLRRARHPLLDASTAVPMDLTLGESYSMVIITGPNTGGKTVALKTLGLLTLLAMSGCFLTTGAPSEIGWCDGVFVDIGDEQSIEQSLSTFSSHMRTIVDMLTKVTKDSLVLLDELGAGTDPTEGAALAMAILDDLQGYGCRVMATTHYPELKAYGFREPSAINASVEFDVETLRPTYRLQVGVPGRSNAIAIASRLGLPSRILNRAKEEVHSGDVRVDDLIRQMETARKEAEQALEVAEAERARAESLRAEWTERWEALHADLDKQRERAMTEAREVVQKAQREANRVIEELRKRERGQTVKDHELVALRKALEGALPADGSGRRRGNQQRKSVAPGSIVRVLSLGQKGEVVEASPDGTDLVVQMGLLRTKVKSSEVEVLQEKAAPIQTVSARRGLPKEVKLELDVRGEVVEEACVRIDRYLDDAALNGLPRVGIIHGKGTGALRDGVRRYLTRHPHVASWAAGGPSEGGDGVTIVTIK